MTHQESINRYLALGGDPKEVKRLKSPNLKNRARVIYLLSQLESKNVKTKKPQKQTLKAKVKPKTFTPDKIKFLGLISNYPVELHKTYKKAFEIWINICELKLKLNLVPTKEERKAFEIQLKMFRLLENFDIRKKALDYYQKHKRILPTKTKKDFSKLTPIELFQTRNNLRRLITGREKTIRKQEKNLPHPDDEKYFKRLDMLNRKREQLQEKILELEKVEKLMR